MIIGDNISSPAISTDLHQPFLPLQAQQQVGVAFVTKRKRNKGALLSVDTILTISGVNTVSIQCQYESSRVAPLPVFSLRCKHPLLHKPLYQVAGVTARHLECIYAVGHRKAGATGGPFQNLSFFRCKNRESWGLRQAALS